MAAVTVLAAPPSAVVDSNVGAVVHDSLGTFPYSFADAVAVSAVFVAIPALVTAATAVHRIMSVAT